MSVQCIRGKAQSLVFVEGYLALIVTVVQGAQLGVLLRY